MAMQTNSRHGRVPTVSVILSVRNGGSDLPPALETILKQSFADLELIAINNGSTDGTREYLDGLTDTRVRVFHQADAGLAAALNRGISLARGRFIARQDHDDLADPERIAKQVAFLDAHPTYAMVGTRAEIWVGNKPSGRFHDHPTDDAELRFGLLFNNYFVHSSVMIRRSALDEVGVYSTDRSRQPPEDYELWSRIARRFSVANLPERLTIYREVATSMSRDGNDPFKERLIVISAENLAAASTGSAKPEQVHLDLASLVHGAPERMSRRADIEAMCAVLQRAGASILAERSFDDGNGPLSIWSRNLRYHFKIYQYGLHPVRRVARQVGKVWRRILFST
jgi:glycosyltransferase involved in cell wall biosynthesis